MKVVLALMFLAAPVMAQTQAIAPAASRLFAIPTAESVVVSDSDGTVRPTPKGAIIGFLVGAGLGWSYVAMSQGGCGVETAGGGGSGGGGCGRTETMPRVIGALVGAFAGVIVGSLIAGRDAPTSQ